MSRVVLASASPRRKELLRALIDDFEVVPSNVPEEVGEDAVAGAERLAVEKAMAVSAVAPGSLVIASDTVVFDGKRTYGKPSGPDDARAMLTALAGRQHRVATGLAVIAVDGTLYSGASVATVALTALDSAAIDAYVRSGRPMDKAGAYAIQDGDVPTVASLEGCYCCVMGLPLWHLRSLLLRAPAGTREPSERLSRCSACPERTSPGAH